MTGSAALERSYRRLLAWYPRSFRAEHEEEMLAVLMAGTGEGQRRPRLAEAADVIKSALWMRLRPARAGQENTAWTDALALFSVIGPLFLLLADILEVALPYRLSLDNRFLVLTQVLGKHPQIGGLPLLGQHGFAIAAGGQVIIAAVALLGLRRTALAAIAAAAIYWFVARYWIPGPLQVLSTGAHLLTAAALVASPGPRRGRQLLRWRHGVVLLLAGAAVQASTLLYDSALPFLRFAAGQPSGTGLYMVISMVLAAGAVTLAVSWKLNRYLLLLLAAMVYPYGMKVAFSATGNDTELIGRPTPGNLALLYIPPLLLACWVLLSAIRAQLLLAGRPIGRLPGR